MSHSVWHRLVRPNNSQAQNTDPSKVIAMSTWDVDDLKTAVWNKNPNSLRNIDASDLKVYKNQASLAANESLKPWVRVTGLGQSYEDPVIIVVPLPSSRKTESITSPILMVFDFCSNF
ncbi:hypothetical protein BDR26DRAFT_901786 [Obelidium mucronatum]|nr:hypothetical protein BDR26DRAFT_901786 [Obelidium mucronatum]